MTHNDGTMADLRKKVELEISKIRSEQKNGTLPTSKYVAWYEDKMSKTKPGGKVEES